MTEAKHTPGVWEKGWGSGLSGSRVAPTVYLDGVGCAQIPIRSGSAAVAWILCDKKDVHANADASLIAAAPELLEALQESVQLFEVQSQMHRLVSRRAKGMHGIAVDDDVLAIEWQSLRALADCMIERRDKAIAKATGN